MTYAFSKASLTC